ncbi:hypothetical protein G17_00098 [Escherichia phage vB_EcoM_G17]|nr:hypothetical protein G17_00098 [Escherichia phage vB_EcoM_G17]WNN14422.1 hypothetical protein Sharanji_gp134 [Escherichia phage Sharanji]
MNIDLKGATRTVILIGEYAIKIPTFKSWKLFLTGMIANLNERSWMQYSNRSDSSICPTLWSSCTGLVTVQKRCKPVQHRGLFWVELCALALNSELSTDFFYSDAKPENFGYLGGKLVKLDYGD